MKNYVSSSMKMALLAAVAVIAACCAWAPAANAAFGLQDFSAQVLNQAGDDENGAGAHPDSASVMLRFNAGADGSFWPDGNVRTIRADLPAGFAGNPQAAPTCTRAGLILARCSAASQVGQLTYGSLFLGIPIERTIPVFNIDARKGDAADFGVVILGAPIHITIRVREGGDYGLRATIQDLPQVLPILGTRLTLWGVPAAASNDQKRGSCADTDVTDVDTDSDGSPDSGDGNPLNDDACPAGVPARPFLNNPTFCGPPVDTRVAVNSWEDENNWQTATSTTSTGPLNCDRLSFQPTIRSTLERTQAETPTGLGFEINVPQNDNPVGLSTPSLRRAVVSLPAQMTLNPSSADGLEACSDEQIGLGTTKPIGCPLASVVGNVKITTPLLAEPLEGNIYLGTSVPGKRYRIFIAPGNDVYGISIRLEGVLTPDPVTGLITTTFEDNPQLPFSKFELHFKGGPRAPLATPQTCGTATTNASLTPWADPNAPGVPLSDSVTISWDGNGAPCPAPGFAPSYRAGGTTPKAGADTKFSLTFGREDRERYLQDTAVTLPKGLLARIGSVPLCGDGQAAAGTCDASSQVGTTTVGAGAGPLPFFLGGKVFITGPYKGAPYGMSIVVPAKAGPFDLGTVVVRAAIFVDRSTAQLKVVSDPLPQILEGIPLRMRRVNVTIDRDKFMINPTSCGAASVSASIGSVGGAAANVSSPFQIVNCRALPFRPKMTIKAGTKGKLTRGKRTPLDVSLEMPLGQANNRSVRVTLPLALNARLDVVNKRRACTEAQFAADRCPMQVGEAVAVTPLLRDPLKGPAYFVYTPARRLPDLVVRLRGPINIDLVGKVTIARDLRLVTTFDAVPDAPITKFRLSLASGGTNGPIGIVRNLCSTTTRRGLKADLAFIAQSGQRLSKQQQISVVGCGRAARRSTRRASRRSAR